MTAVHDEPRDLKYMNDRPMYARSLEQTRFDAPTTDLGADLSTRVRDAADWIPPGAVFGGRTAAWIHGVDSLPPGVDEKIWPIEIVFPPSASSIERKGVRTYRFGLPPDDVIASNCLAVTSLARTAMDCMRCLPRLDAVGVVDQLLRLGVSQDDLLRRVSELRDRRYARRLRTVLHVVDPAAESPAESRCRCLIIDAGLPRPESQIRLDLPSRRSIRLDFGYRAYRLALEYDGAEFHPVSEMATDIARRQAIREAGWNVLVMRSSDVYGKPEHMLWQLRSALRAAGWAPRKTELDRINRNINYIAMRCREDRELWFGTTA